MSRTEKLFHRLDELEAEYLKIVRKEFETFLQGRRSRFLDRMDHWYDIFPSGRSWQNEAHAHLLWLEKEIESLRLKLDQPIGQSPVGAVQELFRKLQAAKNSASGAEFPLVNEFLKLRTDERSK